MGTTKKQTRSPKTTKPLLDEARPFPPSPRPDLHAESKSKKARPTRDSLYGLMSMRPLGIRTESSTTPLRRPLRQPAREIHLHTRRPD